jgi:hypothetical protein
MDRAIKLNGAGTSESTGTRLTFASGVSFTPTSDWGDDCAINYGEGLPASQMIFKTRDAAADEDEIFEVSGFRIIQPETTNKVGFLLISNGSVTTPLRAVMVHDNLLMFRTNWDSTYQYNQVISLTGNVYGVFYNNEIYTRKPYINFSFGRIDEGTDNNTCAYTGTDYNWINRTYKPGTQDTFVLEDNTWHFYMTTNIHMGGSSNGQNGYVIRYNTYNNHDTSAKGQGAHDVHGAYTSLGPPFGAEVYGNYFKGESVCTVGNTLAECLRDGDYYQYGVTMLHTRAGRNMVWNNLTQNMGGNKTLAGSSVLIKRACDECDTTYTVNTQHACVDPGFTTCLGRNRCSSDDQPQYVADTYIFQNRYGDAGTTLSTYVGVEGESSAPCACLEYSGDTCIHYARCSDHPEQLPKENREWWRDNTGCTTSACLTGIGCGATKPTGSCIAGTAYWVTDQDCTTLLPANVGATTDGTHSTKVRTGSLYRCEKGSPPKWSDLPYYTPLPYPHPLRGSPPVPPSAVYNAMLLTDTDVVTLYKFEDGALTTDSRGTNTLTNNNTASSSGTKAEGSYSTALASASSQSYTIAGASLSNTFPGKEGASNKTFSITGWFRAASLPASGNSMVITAMTNSTSTDWTHAVLLKNTGGNTNVKFILGTYYVAQSQEYTHATNLSADTWYHFTASFDGTSAYAIRLRDADGAAVGTDITGTYDGNSDTAISFASGMYFNGFIDELVFFTRAISSDDAGNIASGDYLEATPTDSDDPIPSDPCAGYASCRRPIIEIACEEADKSITIYHGLKTNENATCKWDTTSQVNYTALTNTYGTTGTQDHSDTLAAVACAATKRIYYACKDESDNESDVGYFDVPVADYDDADAPVITNLTVNQGCAVTNKLTVTTDKASTCFWCLDSETCTTDALVGSMTQMVFSEGNTRHIAFPSQAASSTATYNIKCRSTQGVVSAATQVSLTTGACLGITIGGGPHGITFGTGKHTINFK